MKNQYATCREELEPGILLKHITTGGFWKVLVVHQDGSIFGQSDMGARRTVPADKVERGLELGAMFEAVSA